ncbi:dienelactone hydrolase family protein [Tropicimonas sp. TH_r6]|uniref:dienelactone hydrolase family protein n=1 Tax=Tropicimonas sp. TH_r6 TaxID=3082085 RepID=UPI002954B953|nr:dienelactone hydrolase family protein [Tropicimonas sp. TH_r6]MDV7145994.1 dienelactone hydrolase family protein [Tropicimonas sp. TH_r6]
MITSFLWAGLAILVLGGLVGCNALARYHGFGAKVLSPEQLSHRLKPAYHSYTPDGAGPWPTALLFSGCDGPKDNMERWASDLAAQGWASLVVDSHGPRGYDDAQLWRLICIGQLLPGPERAGDVAVAIEDARAMPFVDPDRIALIGASHGGWSVLDMLSLHGQGKPPHNLTRWPASINNHGLEGIVGTVLLYPYCGVASQVYDNGWKEDVPALFLLVEDDSVVNEDACIRVIERMRAAGRPVEAHLFKGTTHGFDQAEKNVLSTLEFSPEATGKAMEITARFLARISGK